MPGKVAFSSVMALALAAGSASAGSFSFRSDDNHRGWTFQGVGNIITASAQLDAYQLLVDDHNGPLAPLQFDVRMQAEFEITPTGVVNVFGTTLHTYALNGGFTFRDWNTNLPLLIVGVQNGAMTSLGTPIAWGASGNLQGSDVFVPQAGGSSVTYNWFGPDLPGYQVFAGTSIGIDDFGFTLTSIVSASTTGLPVTGTPLDRFGLPLVPWVSEGSFSGTAYFVPTPGAMALAGLGGAALLRRRR
jgi:uncharacterized protein (TIGR03382 family)